MNEYLVPANSKKSSYILGLFTKLDLFIVSIGLVVSIGLLLALKNTNLVGLIFAVVPLALSVFLVFPVPNYHNIRQLITNIFTYYTGRKKYLWKGWCVKDEQDGK